ncbi:pentapeptide repeat-containing protein [Streptomyces avidinii]|uniref:pentapeptide repeat-containing protein n=1 Tax=Streptomyces avidinii TaxID=1895 RepID=UPI00379D5230
MVIGLYLRHLFRQTPLDQATWDCMTASEKATATGQWRTVIVQGAAAAGATIALLVAALTYRLSRRGQFTERFTKALERLAEDDLYLRIGAIHALEHVASDSRAHRDNVTEVLSDFVSKRSKEREHAVPLPVFISNQLRSQIDSDVQAALDALGRHRRPAGKNLDWRNFDLRDAVLEGTRLERVNLSGALLNRSYLSRAKLRYAVLVQAQLRYARLRATCLSWADLTEARIQHASLVEARLQHAVLHEARLQHADLSDAQLCHADLTGAQLQNSDLTRANLKHADLSGANLHGARGVTASQLKHTVIDEYTTLPDHLVRHARGVPKSPESS